MNSLDRNMTLAQIVLEHPEAAPVLQQHRLDFCCRGELTIPAACAGKGIDAQQVFADLEQAMAERRLGGDADPRAMSTAELVAFIVVRHHAYLRRALPYLEPLAEKVARVHGPRDPRLVELYEVLHDLREAIEPHLAQEEEVLFPAITARRPDEAVIAAELASMRRDHLHVGELLTRMRTLSNDFTTPGWGCGSYRALTRDLAALETDVLRHVHLENHVLLPRFARLVQHEEAGATS